MLRWIALLLVSVGLLVAAACDGDGGAEPTATLTVEEATDAPEAPPPEPTKAGPATTTFSKYGFAFEYPQNFSVTEQGLFQNEADDNSGVVAVGVENGEAMVFVVSWVTTVTLIGNLEDSLEGGFEGLEAGGDLRVERGELIETERDGQRMISQFFAATASDGQEAHGILAAFYCEDSQKLFGFNTLNTTISSNEDVLQDFQGFLDTFVC